jgi:hypothetical protein
MWVGRWAMCWSACGSPGLTCAGQHVAHLASHVLVSMWLTWPHMCWSACGSPGLSHVEAAPDSAGLL